MNRQELTVSEIRQTKRPLNQYERPFKVFRFYTVMFGIFLFLLLIHFAFRDGISGCLEVLKAFPFLIGIYLFIWLLQFLDCWDYLRRYNRAVREGEYFEGEIVRTLENPGRRSSTFYEYIIQLENGQLVRTPIYDKIAANSCDVYFYRKKYYFRLY